ncbi:MAG: DMT family transporter [Lentisphaerae bacterium]|nr:MAG: DMT family transporter [Lentisphaerota bacterium]
MFFFRDNAPLLFPLCSAILYALGGIALKAAGDGGISNTRAAFVCNALSAFAFAFLYPWHNAIIPSPFWPVLALAALFVAGQICTIKAFATGEVSEVTPVFGVKVVIVSFLVAFVIGNPLSLQTWIGAVLSVAGITLLQMNDRKQSGKSRLKPMLFAFLAAGSFAGFDAMTQYWSPKFGFGNFVPPAMLLAAGLSFAFLPGAGSSQPVASRTRFYLYIGAALFSLQAILLIRSIGTYGNAAEANVIYSSRGLWGISLVWLVGTWFGNRELKGRHPRIIFSRIAGAISISIATLLIVF